MSGGGDVQVDACVRLRGINILNKGKTQYLGGGGRRTTEVSVGCGADSRPAVLHETLSLKNRGGAWKDGSAVSSHQGSEFGAKHLCQVAHNPL